ncbi:MAG: hypothetical protein ABJH45_16300 [Paracoccaceae bacterium]
MEKSVKVRPFGPHPNGAVVTEGPRIRMGLKGQAQPRDKQALPVGLVMPKEPCVMGNWGI